MRSLFDFLFPPRVDELALRSISTDDFLSLLAPRLVPGRREVVGLLPFSATSVRAAIHEAKYHGSGRAFALLAAALAEFLADLDEGFSNSFIVVPVPLGKTRRRERGFNQVEEVTRQALHSLGDRFVLDTGLLERVRETESQVSLERHRREENMRGAFCAAHPADPSRTYIVIDDVITTGATLQAAIDALKEAGAVHIIPLALAH
jgi:ComF family protein